MSKRSKKTKIPVERAIAGFRLREGALVLSLACALFLILSLSVYPTTARLQFTVLAMHSAPAAGAAGAWVANSALFLLGYVAYCLPCLMLLMAWRLYQTRHATFNKPDPLLWGLRLCGVIATLLGACLLLAIFQLTQAVHMRFFYGGMVGFEVLRGLLPAFNVLGSTLLVMALFLSGLTLSLGLSWIALVDYIGLYSMRFGQWCWPKFKKLFVRSYHVVLNSYDRMRDRVRQRVKSSPRSSEFVQRAPTIVLPEPKAKVTSEAKCKPRIEPQLKQVKKSKRALQESQVPLFDLPDQGALPAISLLDMPPAQGSRGFSTSVLENMSRDVEIHLQDFNVEAQVVAVHPGPVITRFELQLAPGVKVSKVSALAKDLARSLSVTSVRIVEVIPGKTVVGLEVPNTDRETVYLSEVLASQQYEQARSPLTLALGKDISGHPVIVDLAKMPHLLVAGTTGSGKSVSINVMLMSLLYKASAEDVRIILIDPKMLELSIYEGIPHLLTPVVTDMKEAANALRWCVGEMERRYRLMAGLGVRNISGFNARIAQAEKKGETLSDPNWPADAEIPAPVLEKLPFIVVVVDEFADMMMVVGKKVEQLFARIAQKARAAGIHMILATQRPSVDVITGLIKANVPTRIAFQVSSKIDSRTILDQQGAEQLLGHGDMLYLPPGSGVPVRVHGAFVDDHEVHGVVDDLRSRGDANYLEDVLEGSNEVIPGFESSNEQSNEDADPLYDQAVQIVIETRKASISGIQRRLKIGYNRAARLVEAMEAGGLVGPMESNGQRDILIPKRDEHGYET